MKYFNKIWKFLSFVCSLFVCKNWEREKTFNNFCENGNVILKLLDISSDDYSDSDNGDDDQKKDCNRKWFKVTSR